MEAFMVVASASAAATKEVALSASVAAAAAAEDAAAAAATDKEATVTAKDAATTASAAALNGKKAAVVAATVREVALAAALNAKETAAATATAREAALAAALSAKETAAAAATAREAAMAKTLNAKEAAAIAVTAREAVEAAAATASAAMQASKKCKFYRIKDDQGPPRSGDVDDMGSVDLISRLPDTILGSIVSLLPTKEGACTQAISRQWGSLWRSAPLNLVADRGLRSKGRNTIGLISKIISEHLGPTRRFSLCLSIINRYDKIKGWRYLSSSYCYDKIEGWLKELEGDLEELELTYSPWFADEKYLLPSSTYRFAPKLRVAKFGGCHFPNLITPLALEFPCLKQLTLESVTISEEALQSMLSGCSALESLELKENFGFRRLSISSQTLKSIGFCTSLSKESVVLQELVIKDTPCLERFLHLNPAYFSPTIQIISAPKLKVLGMLSGHISELHLGTTVFKKMHAVSLTTKMHTMRVLVVYSGGPNLDLVVNFLKCFPCLERLYVIFHSGYVRDNDQQYDPLDPIECLELHLKKVVLKNYDGTKVESIDLTKYLVLNAKVLKEMKITLPYHRQHNWFANQRRLLQIRNRASKDAQIELKCGSTDNFNHNRHTHDLSMAAPFDIPSRGCSKCNRGPF